MATFSDTRALLHSTLCFFNKYISVTPLLRRAVSHGGAVLSERTKG